MKIRIIKTIAFLLLILSFGGCLIGKQHTQEKKIKKKSLIVLDSAKITNSCGSGFKVSHIIESDKKWRRQLEKYLYKSFIDYKVCDKIPDTLYIRDSFVKMVLYIYEDKEFLKNSIYDYESRWRESYTNMLLYCTNVNVLYKLTDSLLKRNINDGLVILWDKDISKLGMINNYIKMNSQDFYKMAELVIIYHNIGQIDKRDELLKGIIPLKKKESEILQRLISRDGKVDYFTYMEEMFGGM